MRDARIELAT